MKTGILLLMLATAAVALDREEVDRLLVRATELQGDEYLAVRQQFEKSSGESLPVLREAAEDPRLTWQQRLVARIAVERIVRGDEIQALERHDWNSYPPFVKVRENPRLLGPSRYGVAGQMRQYVVPKMKQVGLWYYYIEQNWKTGWPYTMETGRGGQGFAEYWARWCREALEGQPEEIYLWWAIADRVEKDGNFIKTYDNRLLFSELVKRRMGMAVGALIGRWSEYVANDYPTPKPDPALLKEMYQGFLLRILSYAESQHVELLERFITEHEELLGEFRPKLEEVRRREPVVVEEPAFRCEKKPPLEGMVKPPPGLLDLRKRPEPEPPVGDQPDVVIEVN